MITNIILKKNKNGSNIHPHFCFNFQMPRPIKNYSRINNLTMTKEKMNTPISCRMLKINKTVDLNP